jgi:N-acetylmuramoyl-L-alanine amidase
MPLPPSAPATSVRGITHSKLPRGDRLTIELTSEGAYSTTRAANPDRVILEVANATAGSGITERASGIAGNLVKSVTVTKGNDEATRFVMEVTGNPRFSTFPLYSPNRLILDIETEAPAQPVSMQPVSTSASGIAAKTTTTPLAVTSTPAPSTPASTSRGEYPLARQLGLGVSRIVVDPGHGGHDPGAQANGVTEAELVLDIATRVAAILGNQAGVDVVLTRKTDEFIPLEERTAIANREKADMFISIHANASLQSATRGIETYFLDFATTEEAKALAARENASSTQSMRLLPDLVRTIALTNKADESRELARSVQTSLVRRLAPDAKGLRDLGVKRAPFVVLIGAQMPSVLAEVSFLTNRADASLLKQPNYRQRIAQALADAILKYRSSLKKVAPTPGTRSD